MSEYNESATIDIQAPIDRVFEFITNIENLPTWAGAFASISDYSGDPVRVGSTWTSTSMFMGQSIISSCKMTQLDPPHTLVFRISNMSGDGDNIWTLEQLDDQNTRFTLQLKGKAKGIAAMAVGLIRAQADRQMNSDLAKLKQLLEA